MLLTHLKIQKERPDRQGTPFPGFFYDSTVFTMRSAARAGRKENESGKSRWLPKRPGPEGSRIIPWQGPPEKTHRMAPQMQVVLGSVVPWGEGVVATLQDGLTCCSPPRAVPCPTLNHG